MAGAPVHAPMHSTSSNEKTPSSVVSLWPDLELFLHEFVELIAAAQHAGHIRADLNVKFPCPMAAQHRVILHRFGDLQSIQIEAARDFADHVIADVAELILRVQQHGDQR
jgi:hypothetical protein